MNTMNQITIMGRLTATPELRNTGGGIAVCSFYLAVDRPHRKSDEKECETDFFRVVAWRNYADFICKYYEKGDLMLLTGVLRTSQYQVEGEEKPRTQTEIVVREIYYSGGSRSKVDTGDSEAAPEDDVEDLLI